MNSTTFHEASRFPRFILIILIFQFIVMTLIMNKEGSFDMAVVYITVPLILLFTFSVFKLKLNKNNLEYSFFPFTFQPKKIVWDDIQQIQFIKADPLFDFGGWGIRLSKKYGVAYIMGNNDILFLTLKNGKKRSFSIKDKELLIRFFDENGIDYR